jgi:DNA-binding IclR family transcriptional regulator
MRLTYRTVRVLAAVATHPGSSNRRIAHAAGIEDQGQISKLLVRLERLGLVDNTDTHNGKGTANAWMLTTAGHDIQDAIAAQIDCAHTQKAKGTIAEQTNGTHAQKTKDTIVERVNGRAARTARSHV